MPLNVYLIVVQFKDSYTNAIHEVPFNDNTVGLCKYDNQYNMTECDAVYVKPTVFREHRTYMHCGKLNGKPYKNNGECAYDNCVDGKCRTLSEGPSDDKPQHRKKILTIASIITFAVILFLIKIY